MARLVTIRDAEPPISRSILRQLPEWFATSESEFPLDPSYEPTEDPKHPEREEVFEKLQKLRSARLLVPVDEEHMYYAALNSTACRLTALGRLYWQMAREDRL